MGSNRGFSKEQLTAEVFGKLSNHQDKKELFEVWKAYNELRSKGVKAIDAIQALYGENVDYFTAVGFELFNKEYLEVLEESK